MRVFKQMWVRGAKGFTLVELMVVVAVVAILAAMSTPTLTRSVRRTAARESASNMAQLFRTARTQAMSRGEIVLLRLDSSDPSNFATMSAAPNTQVGTLTSPVMRSCRLLTNFGAALLNPHADAAGTPIAALKTPLEDVLDPNMVILTGLGPAQRDLCFSPDGRVFDGATGRAVNYGCAGGMDRGFLIAVGRDPGGSATSLPNVLASGSIDIACVRNNQATEASVARDAAYAYMIEVTYNGAVTVE